ncbi:hypothetical protein BD309DRAFT_991721 [Dichomitus squalens]|uniref:Translation machinery-associated protein 16 n=1 Tax=Dichomitus squalens TaxID=114155 RepID=A0A4V2K3Y9_9APHY|nr:uncharacterized protein DICSQDRAFT_144941 [Dichomitus squalens LYAD-421 SS1]EJF64268.1 hypothetical protein DICSQDRAFT_144941 [Dichomitus squalens LYAD-421 SS1]TBU30632.1 hypothetical protein BD311DRAFT_776636 [Dichomitus squalens]TBU42393.1 hypothetical protein BD309DRAFT_991721 [Dichomitus squalens]TBU61004.1 hypothetical protein BD310DRAFT_256187 [Dichomitus squalens]
MAPSKAAASKSGGGKKEKVFHPQSRKAGQLVRTQLRKSRLVEQSKERNKKLGSQASVYSFFYHALPPEGELSLEELHFIVREIWLARLDQELEAEKASRRKGRPKSAKEQKLEDQKLRETELYRTGMEVVDLTHPTNVELFRKWDQKEAAYVQQLRFVRISSASPETVVVSRPGHHPLLKQEAEQEKTKAEAQMDTDEAPLLLEPPSRFASTMQTMDGM